jgi:hypothetical protein
MEPAMEMEEPKFTPEVLASLKPGDLIETGKIFVGMTDEPMTWKVTSISKAGVVNFEVRYFGILVYRAGAKAQSNGTIIWTEIAG